MAKKILVVVDMQNDFIDGPLGNDECKAVVENVVNVINNNTYDKIYMTYDTHNEDYLKTQEGKNLPVEHCIKDTHGWQISEALADFAKQAKAVVEKPTYGSMELIK